MLRWTLFAAGATAALLSVQPAVADGYKGLHKDYRDTPRVEFDLDYNVVGEFDPQKVAESYLNKFHETYKISDVEKELKFSRVKHSLLGAHVHFSQQRGEVAVRGGEIIVSVLRESSQVYKVFNNFYPEQPLKAQKPKLDKDAKLISKSKAYDIAWKDLRVHGELLYQPSIRKEYFVNKEGEFKLIYATHLNTQAPFGSWSHLIDAKTGEVIKAEDTSISQKITNTYARRTEYKGDLLNRRNAFMDFHVKTAKKTSKRKALTKQITDGSGFVFDPDPRTTLNKDDLKDDSPAEAFEGAYFKKTLTNISYAIQEIVAEDGTVTTTKEYHLAGPWVKLSDFERPNVAPSTTADGVWNAKRGDVAFNDVMTYYHVDKTQRYIQSLGFKGETGIQNLSIEVDANGVNGGDNSHYLPGENKLAFGHGCVDDNEDADVILHEYGHAINKHINSNWAGGDTGAMGEGFGDYWAASYSLSTTNGQIFKPDVVFTWDAASSCWPGRRVDKVNMMYDSSSRYGAHRPIGSDVSDELWSTPLFQSLKHLMSLGVPRDEADQIVLEAQFGLGSSLSMRDMAHATVSAASLLYPEGIHAQVFKQKFSAQDIIEAPRPVLKVVNTKINGMGDNNVIDPGETIEINVDLKNEGTLDSGNILAKLTSDQPMISIESDLAVFASMEPSQEVSADQAFRIKVSPDFTCGDKIDFNLTFDTETKMLKNTTAISVPTGTAITSTDASISGLAIPNATGEEATSTIFISSAEVIKEGFSIDVNIKHTYIGDLTLVLESPSGTKTTLWKDTTASTQNLTGTFPLNLTPKESLESFVDESLQGEWKLTVVDSVKENSGKLVSWAIHNVTGYHCK